MVNSKTHFIELLTRVRDMTDNSGGATFGADTLATMRGLENDGFAELHYGNRDGAYIARITKKGRREILASMVTEVR